MTSQTRDDGLDWVCDTEGCGVTAGHDGKWKVCGEKLKKAGWRVTTPDDGRSWLHFCPACVREFASKGDKK